MPRIQLVDDDLNILGALQRVLHRADWHIDAFEKVTDALTELDRTEYALIIADYRMPKLDGVSYLEWARQKQPAATRLMLSAYPESEAMIQAINRAEVFRFITKPWSNEELLLAVAQGISRSHQAQRAQLDVSAAHRLLVEEELAQLERIEPGITRIEFDEDGAIRLELDDYPEIIR